MECDERKSMAQHLLSTSDEVIDDDTTLKIRTLFIKQWEVCATTGTCPFVLWELISDVNVHTPLDQQALEGSMNQIKHISGLAPGIEWPLLSSRLTSVQEIAPLLSRMEREAFVQKCVSFDGEASACLKADDEVEPGLGRFDVVQVAQYPPLPYMPPARAQQQTVHDRCAASMIRTLKQRFKGLGRKWESSSLWAFHLFSWSTGDGASVETPSDFWFPANLFRECMWVTKATALTHNTVCIGRPMVHRPLLHVLAELHRRQVCTGGDGKPFRQEYSIIELISTAWDRQSTNTCSTDDECIQVLTIDDCPCTRRRKRRQRPGGVRSIFVFGIVNCFFY